MTAAESTDRHLADAYAHVTDVARRFDRDRWLASLWAPTEARLHLHAIFAFSCEIARIRDVVSDPLPGEVRARWWAEVVAGERRAEGAGHPVGAAILDTVERFALPRDALGRLVDARIFDLYDDPMPSLGELDAHLVDTVAVPIDLAARVLAGGRDLVPAEAVGPAGVAWGLTGLLRVFPFHASRGRIFLPVDLMEKHRIAREDVLAGRSSPAFRDLLAELVAHARDALAETREAIRAVPPECAPAFLVVALVEPMLDHMEAVWRRPGVDPFRTSVELPEWRRLFLLWRAARSADRACLRWFGRC